MKWFAHALAFAALALLVVSPAGATQPECQVENQPPKKARYNSNTHADPLGTAIAEAAPGDTLQVVGTCHGNFVITEDLTIVGRPAGQHTDTIDGDLNGIVLNVPDTVNAVDLTVKDLTITGGTRGIAANRAHLVTLTNVTVSGNAGTGITNYGGSPFLIENSFVSDNHAADAGSGGFGGGIYNSLASMTIKDSTVVENTATGLGGGIFTRGNLSVSNSTIEGNSAGQSGGGVYVSFAATITDSTVTGNIAAVAGGGIWGNATLVGTNIVCGNTPDDWPGCSP